MTGLRRDIAGDDCQMSLFDLGIGTDGTAGKVADGDVTVTRSSASSLPRYDAIVSNPPYQVSDGGASASARPVYPLFVTLARRLFPSVLSVIMPARWYTGGKGLDAFRQEMLDDPSVRELHDFPNPEDCFPSVNIRGGVCVVAIGKEATGDGRLALVTTHEGGTTTSVRRSLRTEGIGMFVRHHQTQSILEKVLSRHDGPMMDSAVSPRRPFGIGSAFSQTDAFHDGPTGLADPIACYGRRQRLGYIERSAVTAHPQWIDAWKVGMPRANNIGTELADDNLNSFVIPPGTVCTEAYLVAGADICRTEEEATRLARYLRTRFARFMHSVAKASQDATAKTYRFVPLPDLTDDSDIDWSADADGLDRQMFAMFGLDGAEVAFIESHILPMG